jgi:predicted O-linked N-acetylglucosamine transferase (SPINDLY family)
MPDAAALEKQFQEALAVHQQGDFARARDLYRGLLVQAPEHPHILYLLGILGLQTNSFAEAADLLGRATKANPHNPDAWFNHGMALLNLQQHAAAAESFGKVTALQPGNPDAHNNRAIALRALGRHEEALAGYDAALALRPGAPETHNNRAITLAELERYEEAAESSVQALRLDPDYAAAYNNQGNVLRLLGRYDDALASFTRAIALEPDDHEAHNNRGLLLTDMKQFAAAMGDFARAIALQPNFAAAYNNRAICFKEQRQLDAALADYQKAVALNPRYADAYMNIGQIHTDLKRYEDAVANYRIARQINPQMDFLDGHLVYTQRMNCDWQDSDGALAALKRRMASGARATPPFPALVFTDDPAVQRRAIATWVKAKCPAQNVQLAAKAGGKIRVGYFSMDFRDHPLSVLTAGLYEAHDRAAFETFAFSYGQDTKDATRQRLERAFDRFIDVRDKSDAEIVALARELQIDIAVDLAGYTKNARLGVFTARAAPVQVSYLGFPGTLAAAHMDYIIADDVVIRPEARQHYSEKVVYLPHFQSNDDKRVRPTRTFSRAELGLPETGFVFCCFNNSYKFSPETFATWMRILNRAPGSVLFIYADTELAATNLRREAAAHGVDPARVIFGKRLDMADYLARYKAADLFLDTLPYNAGTTAADALWMGLPVLTCMGGAFASRMAASLLQAVGLPELVTANLQDYEDRAVALAADIKSVKETLARNLATSALFNTAAFTRHLEDAYTQMCARARAGLPPDHIVVQ